MKTISLLSAIALVLCASTGAQTINGQRLNIGTQSSGNNNVTGWLSGAISDYSTVSGDGSLSVGAGNTLSGDKSLALGGYNTLGGAQSLVVGSDLYLTEINSIMVGDDNYATSNGYSSNNLYLGYSHNGLNNTNSALIGAYSMLQTSTCSFVAGSGNTVTSATSSFVAGDSNVVTGKQIVLGTGLIAQIADSASVVVGRYNKAQTAPPTGQPSQVFVVGVGTSSSTVDRKNGFEVYTDGTVKIPKRQGDVGMGRFGYTADQ